MSDAPSVSVATAVLAMVSDADLSQKFTAERSYADWELELTDYSRLHVDVVPVMNDQLVDLAARGIAAGAKVNYTVPIDIAVRYRFGQDEQDDTTGRIPNAAVDSLVALVVDIAELFTKQRLTDFTAGVHQETRITANPVKQHLHQLRQFTGIVRVTFRVDRTIT